MAEFRKAWVVDDSKLARFTLTKILEKMGFEVLGVTSGEEALSFMEQEQPDLIFMDFQMPGIDGYEASARITAMRSIPIVICTAQEDYAQELARAKAHGAFDLLRKPVTESGVEGILQKIHTHWEEKVATASAAIAARAEASLTKEKVSLFFQQESAWCQSQLQEALRGLLMEKIALYLAKELTPVLMQKIQVHFQEWLQKNEKA